MTDARQQFVLGCPGVARRIIVVALWTALTLSSACGARGQGDHEPDNVSRAPAPAPSPPTKDDGFSLNINSLGYTQPELGACLRSYSSDTTLPTLERVDINGDFGDWSGSQEVGRDPLGDAPAGFDLGTIMVARVRDDLAFALALDRGPDTQVEIELGGITTEAERVRAEARRVFVLQGATLFDLQGGQLLAVDTAAYSVGQSASGSEIFLSERLLGDVLTWPTFWLKVSTLGGDLRPVDSSSVMLFPSRLARNHADFLFSGCQSWLEQKLPLRLSMVADSGVAIAESKHAVTPPDSIVNWTSALTRFAINAVGRVLGAVTLPGDRLTVLVVGAAAESTPAVLPGQQRGDQSYDYLAFDGRLLSKASAIAQPEFMVIESVVDRVVRMALSQVRGMPESLVGAMLTAVKDHVIQSTVGQSYWLDKLDSQSHVGDGIEAVTPLADGGAWSPAQAARFGHLLAAKLDAKALWSAWTIAGARLQGGVSALEAFMSALTEVAGGKVDIAAAYPGWLVRGEFAPDWDPRSLADEDGDGLPNYIENAIGSRTDKMDSDGDGWSDWSEHILGSDPKSMLRHPTDLVADGVFGDVLELMPRRVQIDRGHTGSCPQAADISHFAAVARGHRLLIAAYAANFLRDEPLARWEAVLDLPGQQRQLVVATKAGERLTQIRDGGSSVLMQQQARAVQMGRSAMEWELDSGALGLKPWNEEKEGARIRIRTIYAHSEGDVFCDETPWFAPVLVATP